MKKHPSKSFNNNSKKPSPKHYNNNRNNYAQKESNFTKLHNMDIEDLRDLAKTENVQDYQGLDKSKLVLSVLKQQAENNGVLYREGVAEILSDGFGFLRFFENSYLPSPQDVYLAPSQIRRFGIRTGNVVTGQVRAPKDNERYFALLCVDAINYQAPELLAEKILFENLKPSFPKDRIFLETIKNELSTRVIDLIAPLGKGQRGLIVAPPKSGKTVLLQKIANAIIHNHPEVHLMVLLVDERPEEVTEMEEAVDAEVIGSTFDKTASRHIQIAEMVIEKAKRMVEYGQDVVILLDSITRLARSYNSECPSKGRILSGGMGPEALQKVKKFFGSARNIQEGGSLTIIATALVNTESRMDDVIFQEFKGTGNMEVYLNRKLAERGIFPAFNLNASGTRKEEILLDPEEHKRIQLFRRTFSEENQHDFMEDFLSRISRTSNNSEFLLSM